MNKIIPIILSGGQGTRLWPLSRSNEPKQFIKLTSDTSLFEETINRCKNSTLFESPIIICSQPHRFLVRKLIPEKIRDKIKIILEPCGRNTAAAVCVAALAAQNSDDILLILPSDHHIPKPEDFYAAAEQAAPLASDGYIVTFGIRPTHAHTGYGYIKRGVKKNTGYIIESFHEKPDSETAETYLKSDDYYWNAGIFMMRADTLLQEIQKHAPDILEDTRLSWKNSKEDLGNILLDSTSFEKVRSQSIDCAVLEKTNKAAVIPVNFAWDDLGSWKSLWNISTNESAENYLKGPVYMDNVSGSYLRSEGPTLGVIGLNDIIAIATSDAVLIVPKSKSEDVKNIVNQMRNSNQSQADEHLKTMRPWGGYEILEEQSDFKVKKLIIDVGCKLSLQKHKHRSEHWVVVKGVATVTRGNKIFNVPVNESVYVPCGTVHRLENKGKETLEIIEIQTGDYLGEDDIIRYKDDYNRENLNIEQKKKA